MVTTLKQRKSSAPIGFSSFLHLVILLLTFLACATTAVAVTYTVSNDSEVPVRSGQGTEYKILALLQNGETVVSLEEAGYWIKVRTATGREGWMLKRYLSSTPSIDDAFTLPSTNNQAGKQPEKASPLGEQRVTTFQPEENVLAENTNPFQLENTNSPVAEQGLLEPDKELKQLRDKLAVVTRENKALREDEQIKWFLAGGGVLVIGWIIGLITCRSRRRKPSLL